MKLQFNDEDRHYFKDAGRPLEDYESKWHILVPRSEILATAKTDAIDKSKQDWWTSTQDGYSNLRVVCLDANRPQDDPSVSLDAVYIKMENGADVIKGTGDVGIWEIDCKIYLHDVGLPEDDQGLMSIAFLKKLDADDYRRYMDLMSMDAKSLALYHSYSKRDAADREQTKKDLRPKWILPLLSVFVYGFLAVNGFYDSDWLRYGSIVLFVPVINYIFNLVRYLRYRP